MLLENLLHSQISFFSEILLQLQLIVNHEGNKERNVEINEDYNADSCKYIEKIVVF